MECGETLEEAAVREIREETNICIRPEDLNLYALSTIRDLNEVYVSFRATSQELTPTPGLECLDVRYFSEEELPWEQLAYPPMIGFFRLFFRERRAGAFSIHLTQLDAVEIARRSYRIGTVDHITAPRHRSRRGA
jgi:8-oxo-dGTP pyrophosphatase MutT (NUDIX family)